MKKLIGLLLVAIVAVSMLSFLPNNVKAITTGTILVSEEYNSGYSFDSSYFEAFKSLLISQGYSVIVSRLAVTQNLLSGVDVLIVLLPTTQYSSSEIDAIEGFVLGGGGLFCIADHTTSWRVDGIIARWGFSQASGYVIDSNNYVGGNNFWVYYEAARGNFAVHPITSGLTRVQSAASNWFLSELPPGAVSIVTTDTDGTASPSGASVYAALDVGTGRIVISMDCNYFGPSDDPTYGLYADDNADLGLNTIAWLIDRSANPTPPQNLAQRTDGVALGVGAVFYVLPVVFRGEVSDLDGDRVKLQVELRRLDEYGGQFNEGAGGFKESEFTESGSEASAYAYGLVDGDYHWRARTVDENGLASDWVDFGNNNIADVDFVFPAAVVYGTVTDGYGHVLSDVEVELRQKINIGWYLSASTTTNGNGEYLFESIVIGTYSIGVNLRCRQGMSEPPIFEVIYNDEVVAYAMTKEFTVTRGERREFNIDFDDSSLDSNWPIERLSDMAAIYCHAKQVVDFAADVLKVTLDLDLPVEIHAFSTSTDGAYYSDGEIYIGEDISEYRDGNRPMNREWHEFFHELMDDTIGIPSYPPATTNHGGYANSRTVDSWVEGWAEFWPCVLWDHLGLSNPHLYRMSGISILGWWIVGGPQNFEENWKAWDTVSGAWGEEFGVASLLWDLYDPLNERDSEWGYADHVDLSAMQIWTVFEQSAPSDMKDLYDALTSAGIGSEDPDEDGITYLDEIFIIHGFFADLNSNHRYDVGEEIGRAADRGRPDRRNTPGTPNANILITAVDEQGNPISDATLVYEFRYGPPRDYLDYTYEIPLSEASNLLAHFEPSPSDRGVTITIYVRSNDLEAEMTSDKLVVENDVYWALVSRSTSDYVVVHTFTMGEASEVTLIGWDYEFRDETRGTILKIRTEDKLFQFITPDKDYGIRSATYMRLCGRAIIINHRDKELRLITVAVDTRLDFCYAIAWDVQARKFYYLLDKPGIEE